MSIPRSTANASERASRSRAAATAVLILGAAWVLSWLGPPEGSVEATQHAYIGPGAGIALLGSFFAVFSAFLSAVFFLISWPIRFIWRGFRGARPFGKAKARRVVVLGLDGLEPTLAESMIDAGKLPNLARLREKGTYTRLGTTTPPLSPVAWSSFSTGTNPGKHNIYDFISRNPASYRPTQSSVHVRDTGRKLKIGPYLIPLSGPDITGLRKSKPFWNVLGEKGIFSAIVRVPITFPPDRFRGVQLSAMCVPDLRGTHGMFSYYTENGRTGTTTEGEVGGDLIAVERDGDAVRSFLRGPDNTLRVDQAQLRIPFRVTRGDNGSPTLHIDGRKVRLTPGQYTDWVPVRFRAVGLLKVRGVCRFMLKQFRPFEMYCTPVQIDPERPIMPISNPRTYSKYLARLQGTYATLGLAEDTWSLSENRLDEDAFLTQAYDIHGEREAMFFDALKRVPRGCVVCVFDGPDRIQHMFWRFIDENHPALAGRDRASHQHVIEEMYAKMDDLVGRTMDEVDDEKTVLFVMSDHGFKPFRRGVDLNAWLLDNGYLALKEGARRPSASYLTDIDWSRTQAYALGLAGIFLNVKGREGQGTVARADAPRVAAEISGKLTGLRDPEGNGVAIHEAMPKETVYRGPYLDAAPDIIIGYTPGYRVSWDAVIGKCGEAVFSDNTKAWSGDHCIHPQLVPGVLFCNRKLNLDDPDIVDLAPTTLDLFGVEKPAYMDGKSLLCAETTN